MATMRKFISRLILRRPSPSAPRCFSTATETATSVKQPRTEKSILVFKVKAKNSESSVTDILNEYQNQGNTVKRYDVVSLSNHFRNRRNYQSALQLYDWLEMNKVEITNADQAIRIDILYKAAGLASAESYFNSLRDSEKTNKTYGALLSCFCKEKVLDKTLEIFEKMKELNYMSTLNYNNMMSLYFSVGQPEKVLSLVQEMEERRFVGDMYTYNLLINSYAAMKNLDAAEGVPEIMKRKNVKFDSFTCGNLATICVNAGLHMKAKTYLEMMDKMENEPYKRVFEAFRTRVKLYSEMEDLSEVIRAWESLKSNQPNPNNTSYLLMLLALSKLGAEDRLVQLYHDWKESLEGSCEEKQGKKICESYDYRLPNVVMEFYINQNEVEKATMIYEETINRYNEPNLRALDLFATLMVKKAQIDEALDYLEKGIEKSGAMKGDWFPSDETIKLFLTYLEENKDVDRIERFVKSMKKVKRLDSMVYESLLSL